MIEYYTMFQYKLNPYKTKDIGLLAFDTLYNKYHMYIEPTLVEGVLPPILFGLMDDELPTDRTIRIWINSRTTPTDRLNIAAILRNAGLAEYDGWELLKAAQGRNLGCDTWGFRPELKPNPEWVAKLSTE